MSRGLTIAELVQQVYYAIYKVRIDVDEGVDGAFSSKTDKFKEVVMEANLVLQEFQKEQDWNFLRDRWEIAGLLIRTMGFRSFKFLLMSIRSALGSMMPSACTTAAASWKFQSRLRAPATTVMSPCSISTGSSMFMTTESRRSLWAIRSLSHVLGSLSNSVRL